MKLCKTKTLKQTLCERLHPEVQDLVRRALVAHAGILLAIQDGADWEPYYGGRRSAFLEVAKDKAVELGLRQASDSFDNSEARRDGWRPQ